MSTRIHGKPPTRQLVLMAGVALWCAYFFLTFLFALFANDWPGPYNDYWADMGLVARALEDSLNIGELITAHNNAHRIVIPRLLFLLDYQWFQGSNLLMAWVGVACKLVTLVLLNGLIRHQAVAVRLMANLGFVAAVFNVNNLYNILYSSNIQWDLMALFSLLALFFFARAMSHSGASFWRNGVLAHLFFILGFLSQAGALPVLVVFSVIAAVHRRWRVLLFSFAFMAFVFYLAFYALPVSNPENPTYESALLMLLTGAGTVSFFVFNLLSSGLHTFTGSLGLYFSAYLLALFLIALYGLSRNNNVSEKSVSEKIAAETNAFLYFALYLFLAFIIIAAARSTFTPTHWASTRFHGLSLLFIVCVSSHCFLNARLFVSGFWLSAVRGLLTLHVLAMLLLIQYFHTPDPFMLANKVFQAHAYMFSHQRNQYDGDKLVTFFNDNDRVASLDPFFKQRDAAYYHNKQNAEGSVNAFKALNEKLLSTEQLATLHHTCTVLEGKIDYRPDEEGLHLAMNMAMPLSAWEFVHTALKRESFYLLDNNGRVQGFVYPYLDPETRFRSARLKGFVNQSVARMEPPHYVVDLDASGKLRCHYQLTF